MLSCVIAASLQAVADAECLPTAVKLYNSAALKIGKFAWKFI